jgi:hypothetical protein
VTAPKVWLVGMNNPYGSDERYALYPEPKNSAGDRLCRVILGMDKHDYMRSFVRRNTMKGDWKLAQAKVAAASLFKELPPGTTVVLLGQQVWEAWRAVDPVRLLGCSSKWIPFMIRGDQTQDLTYILFPHPSGLSRFWNDKSNISLARSTLRAACPQLLGVVPQ